MHYTTIEFLNSNQQQQLEDILGECLDGDLPHHIVELDDEGTVNDIMTLRSVLIDLLNGDMIPTAAPLVTSEGASIAPELAALYTYAANKRQQKHTEWRAGKDLSGHDIGWLKGFQTAMEYVQDELVRQSQTRKESSRNKRQSWSSGTVHQPFYSTNTDIVYSRKTTWTNVI